MQAGNASNPIDPGPRVTASVRDAGRDRALDVAKGAGIVLVVVGHVWRGLHTAGMIGDSRLFGVTDRLIYNFHMPLFFLLSGLTFAGWASRRSLAQALASRVGRLLYPLLLWTYLFTAMRLVAGDAANAPVDGLAGLLVWPLPPRDHLWFLWALFQQHVAVLLVLAALPRPVPGWVWLAAAALAVGVSSARPDLFGNWSVGAFRQLGAFLFGLWLGQGSWRPSGMGAAVIATATFVLLQTASLSLPPSQDDSILVYQLLGIVLSVAFLSVVHVLAERTDGPIVAGIADLGRLSMGIFLAHTIFSAAMRIALQSVTSDLAVHVLAGVAAGIVGPLAIHAGLRRYGRPAWIGF